jgi:phage repressor protein C with HTH and peptisase S24 domain
MLTHAQIWNALDRLAERANLSASGLAIKAGLDPTTFNKSKRVTPEGRARWPSTESVAKALAATGTPVEAFVQLIGDSGRAVARSSVPVIGLAQAGRQGFFDDAGYPVGHGREEVAVPTINDPHAYALKISGDSMEPALPPNTVVIVSPAASVHRGDWVVVKARGGEVMVKELKRRNAKLIELRSLNPDYEDWTLPARDVLWMHRVVWASQ